MKTRTLVGLAILAMVAFIAINRWHRQDRPRRAGNVVTHPLAPDFSVTDLSGRMLQLSHYRGRVILLNFWATWCAPCRSEIPRFVDLQNKYGREGLQIVGISLDDEQKPVHTFYRQFRMNYPVALGDAKLAELYGGILGLPVSFMIGRDGRIYAKYEGEMDSSLIESKIKALL